MVKITNGDVGEQEERSECNQVVSIPGATVSECVSEGVSEGVSECGSDNEASLEMLGPIVLNTDGTMSRISNWSEMTVRERESAKRLVAKRNKSRKEALLASERVSEGVKEGVKEEENEENEKA